MGIPDIAGDSAWAACAQGSVYPVHVYLVQVYLGRAHRGCV